MKVFVVSGTTPGGVFIEGTCQMTIVPMTLKEAARYIREHHRHHKALVGGLFALACKETHDFLGCVVVGRPVARALQDGFTCEVTRMCTGGAPNVCSKLYSAAWRAARALGYTRMVTYILAAEPGTSLRAAGWEQKALVKGRSWTCPSRPRTDKHPTVDKTRWEVTSE